MREQYNSLFAEIYSFYIADGERGFVRMNLGFEKNLKVPGCEVYHLRGSVNLNLNKVVRLRFDGLLKYLIKSLVFPASIDYSNPIQLMMMNSQPGRSVDYVIGLDVTIGNSSKKIRNRKWSDTSIQY